MSTDLHYLAWVKTQYPGLYSKALATHAGLSGLGARTDYATQNPTAAIYSASRNLTQTVHDLAPGNTSPQDAANIQYNAQRAMHGKAPDTSLKSSKSAVPWIIGGVVLYLMAKKK